MVFLSGKIIKSSILSPYVRARLEPKSSFLRFRLHSDTCDLRTLLWRWHLVSFYDIK
jgi:hypothetical protein